MNYRQNALPYSHFIHRCLSRTNHVNSEEHEINKVAIFEYMCHNSFFLILLILEF